jgi:hypothetical protein
MGREANRTLVPLGSFRAEEVAGAAMENLEHAGEAAGEDLTTSTKERLDDPKHPSSLELAGIHLEPYCAEDDFGGAGGGGRHLNLASLDDPATRGGAPSADYRRGWCSSLLPTPCFMRMKGDPRRRGGP